MKRIFAILILTCFLLACCNSATPNATPSAIPETITVQYTSAAVPWLAGLYNCAGVNVVKAEQRAADFLDPQAIDLAIRIGQPASLTTPTYQIGNEDILIIVNTQNPTSALNTEQVRGLFNGQILNWQEINGSDAPVQAWVFSSREDIQQIFEYTILNGSQVSSTARLATGPDEMAQAIANDVNAIGILTRHWKGGNVSAVYTVATVPVLALTQDKPVGAVQELLACLQK